MNPKALWSNWDEEKHYGELLYKRATGESEEMNSSRAVAKVIKEFYKPGMKVLDVGCGAGHYLVSLRKIVRRLITLALTPQRIILVSAGRRSATARLLYRGAFSTSRFPTTASTL